MILLIVIYIAFISLGLPDSVLGSAWPSMHNSLGAPISSAGIISMIVAIVTIVSSLLSDRLVKKIGTAYVTLFSVLLTAIALLGFSFSNSLITVCLWAIPLGLGAGSVDATLNNFVAIHYKAKHMNWLHSFWGIGTIIGPLIISAFLTSGGNWNDAYLVISLLQFIFVGVLFFAIPSWKKVESQDEDISESISDLEEQVPIIELLKDKKTWYVLIAFFCYCAIEQTVMLWGSSFFVTAKDIPASIASGWISMFFIGITIGRLLSGFLSERLTQKSMIQGGQVLIVLGILIMVFDFPSYIMLIGLMLIGLGCAPIYPSLLHETPRFFGNSNSQAIMGIQMASAYLGTTLMPPLFGLLGGSIGYGILPVYIGFVILISIIMVLKIYSVPRVEL
ncbi:MFS transporter [Erysipelothrix anatis]|uniref:MFS transporter n=1 Tax=Erysipelothrix anatis TaxID=2683713 RepID=UPI001A9E6BA9|nr:MFS transporter [Erysipelothrix anatis]